MLIKENTAKMVACPLLGSHSINIGCKASHCMAWRWATPRRDGQPPEDPTHLPSGSPANRRVRR